MKRTSELRVMVITVKKPRIDPFLRVGVQELARRTGYDPSNLSKYKTGKLPCSMPVYLKLCEAIKRVPAPNTNGDMKDE